jgi:hypothetical protein
VNQRTGGTPAERGPRGERRPDHGERNAFAALAVLFLGAVVVAQACGAG